MHKPPFRVIQGQKQRKNPENLPRIPSLIGKRLVISLGLSVLSWGTLELGIRLWVNWLGSVPIPLGFDMGFAPEVWLSVLGVTLGTLVIAISIAAQNIPKITELYMQDWLNLFYMWFLILGACHAVLVKSCLEGGDLDCSVSALLNLNALLPVAIVLVFPYVFYVVRSIQPTTVIAKIYERQRAQLHTLVTSRSRHLLRQERQRNTCHYELLESLNQLENLLEYLGFKEPKLQIIQHLGQLLRSFIALKPQIEPTFFQVGEAVRSDVSFQTMMDHFPLQQSRPTFYEQKVFRLLGNAYIQFLNGANFDLAALCGAELRRVGAATLTLNDHATLELVVIRFNTMMRFALKHGAHHNEARHLYNLVFHYRGFIEDLVHRDERQSALQCFYYLRFYGNEAYALGRLSPALYFIVDVFAAELRSLLMLVYEQNWPLTIQQQLLDELLQVDRPPELDPLNTEPEHLNSGVRTIQISLALFYLEVGQQPFVRHIIQDLLDDWSILGPALFARMLKDISDRLKTAQPTFWEDTDRGNVNLYYSPYLKHLEQFMVQLATATQQR
jgi:hypothetical protein